MVYGQWVKKVWKEESKHSAMQIMAIVPGEITGFPQIGDKDHKVHHVRSSRANVEYEKEIKICEFF